MATFILLVLCLVVHMNMQTEYSRTSNSKHYIAGIFVSYVLLITICY